LLLFSVSAELCEEIAKIRRKVQRVGKDKVLFLDETNKRLSDAATNTIALPGEQAFIRVTQATKYAARYDMIACCSGKELLPPKIFAPDERGRGITSELLQEYIRDLLAQAAGALDRYPLWLVVDRASIHTEEEMRQEFHDWGCQSLTKIIKMPTAAAKRLSPLDNALFNCWRQRVLEGGPLTKRNIKQRMSDAWNSLPASLLPKQYRKCGLMRHQDVYFDCPNPAAHKHGK
jgi:hypothetical protein